MLHPCCELNATSLPWAGLLSCRGCGMVWQGRQPSDADLARIYSSGYFDSWGGSNDTAPYWKLKLALADHLLNQVPRSPERKAVLDIGCATGACLSAIHRRGWEPCGLDVNEHAVQLSAKNVPQAEVKVGTTSDASEWAERFDVVVMSDVIEHVRDPFAEMYRVWALLKPGGYLVLLTPDILSLSARLMGRHWIHYKQEHLFYFSRKGLRMLLDRSGFVDCSMRFAPKPMTLHYAVNQFRSYRVPVVSDLFRLLGAVLPSAAQEATFKVPMGEILAVARKKGIDPANGME